MALRTLKPAIQSLKPTIGYSQLDDAQFDKARNKREPWRLWYNLARWKRLRLQIFKRDHFTCQDCGRLQGDTSQLVADHIEPHRGNPEKFWDENNLQTLCKSPCHDQKKQAQEKKSKALGGEV